MTEPQLGQEKVRPIERARRRRYRKSDPRYTPDHDFRWRAKIRANPQSHFIYRWVVFAVGLAIVCIGLILVPLPGPGWLIVIFGLFVWASEFERAQRLLDFVRRTLRRWNDWVMAQGWVIRGSIGLLTCAFVLLVVWFVMRYSDTLDLLPEPMETWMRETFWL